jgi:large repetitive protein
MNIPRLSLKPGSLRSRLAALVAVALLGGLLFGAARANGQPADKAKFNDASVWEVNRQNGRITRLNLAVDLAGSRVTATSDNQLEVAQSRSAVVLIDRSSQYITAINDRDIRISPNKLKVPADVQVLVSRNFVYVVQPKDGVVYRIDSTQFATVTDLASQARIVDEEVPVVAEIGVDENVHVLVPQTGELTTWKPNGEQGQKLKLSKLSEGAQLTAISATPVAYDPKSESIFVAGTRIKELKAPGGDLTIAMPTVRRDLGLVFADGDGSVSSMDLKTSQTTKMTEALGGQPIRPLVRAGGCVTAASSATGNMAQKCVKQAAAVKKTFTEGNALHGRLIRDLPFVDDLDSKDSATAADNGKPGLLNSQAPDETEANKADDAGETKGSEQDESTDDSGENQPPKAVEDVLRVRPNRTSVLPVLVNDLDPNGDDLFVASIDKVPAEVEAFRSAGGQGVVFRPKQGFLGTASFGVVINDSEGESDSNTVTVTVDDTQNSAPLPKDDETVASVGKQSIIDALSNDLDPDGDSLVLAEATIESGEGDLTITQEGALSLVPRSGDVAIAYTVNDERGLSASAKVAVKVETIGNLAPIARDDLFEVQLGNTTVLDLLANDIDPDGNRLTISGVPKSVAPIGNLVTEGNIVTFNPLSQGEQSFSYQVSDGVSSSTARVKLAVKASVGNRPPLALPDRAGVSPGTDAIVDVLQNDSDPDGDVIGIVSWTAQDSVKVRSTEDGKKLVVSLGQPLSSPGLVVYEISDGSIPVQGTLLVSTRSSSTNLAPIAQDDEFGVRAGVSRSLNVLVNDVDPEGASLRVVSVDNPGIAISKNGKTLTLAQDAFAVTGSFTYVVADPVGNQSQPAKVAVNVVADPKKNDPIRIRTDSATVRAGFVVEIPVTSNDEDPEGDELVVENNFTPPPAKGVVTLVDRVLRYEANAGSVGTDRFFYIVKDGHGATATGEVRIGILPAPKANQAPVAVDDGPKTVKAGESVTVEVMANDRDPDDGDVLKLTNVEKSLKGSAEIAVGSVRFTAGAEPGDVRLRYTISDNAGASASAFVSFKVVAGGGVGQPPVARPDTTASLAPGTSAEVSVLDNDEDPDGDIAALTVVEAVGSGAVVSGDKRTVRVTAGVESTTATYTVRDAQGNLAKGTITVVVGDGNALVARDDKDSVASGGTVVVDVLANDSVLDTNKPLKLDSVGESDGGIVSRSGNKVTFTATKGFAGLATFGYTITDSTGEKKSANVRITVAKGKLVNRPPKVLKTGGPLTLLPGETQTVDLAVLVKDPEGQPLTFAVDKVPGEVTTDLQGASLSIGAPTNGGSWSGKVTFIATDDKGEKVGNEVIVRIAPAPTTTTALARVAPAADVSTTVPLATPVVPPTPAPKIAAPTRQPTVTPTVLPSVTAQTPADSASRSTIRSTNQTPTSASGNAATTAPTKAAVTTTVVNTVIPVDITTTSPPTTPTTQSTVAATTSTVAPVGTTTTPAAGNAKPGNVTVSVGVTGTDPTPNQNYVLTIGCDRGTVPGSISIPGGSSQSFTALAGANCTVTVADAHGGAITVSDTSGNTTDGSIIVDGDQSVAFEVPFATVTNPTGTNTSSSSSSSTSTSTSTSSSTSTSTSTSTTTSTTSTTTTTTIPPTTPTTIAITPPGVPSAPLASGATTNSLNWSWTAPASNGGSPITTYEVSGNNGASFGPVGNATSWAWTGLAAGTPYTLLVRACNAAGCGLPGPAGSGTTAQNVPPGQMNPPTVSPVSQTVMRINYAAPSVLGTLPIAFYNMQINGGEVRNVGGNGTYDWGGLAASSTYSFTMQACNTANVCGPMSGAGSAATPPPPPVVSISKGASAQGQPFCSSAACAYLIVNVQNHTQNTAQAFETNGLWGGTGSGNNCGRAQLLASQCYYGLTGRSVWVIVDGVQSNTIVW